MAVAHVSPRAHWLRALALELERLANHLGDIGAIANDAGFAFGLAQFSRLKETLLRATERALGQRYLMDLIVPGGTCIDLSPAARLLLMESTQSIAAEVKILRAIYDEHAGLRDRFVGAGIVTTALATQLGLTGLPGARADKHLTCGAICHAIRMAIWRPKRSCAPRATSQHGSPCDSMKLLNRLVSCSRFCRSCRSDPIMQPSQFPRKARLVSG